MFDKAKRAADLEALAAERDHVKELMTELRSARSAAEQADRASTDTQVAAYEARIVELDAELADASHEPDPDDD